MILLKFFNSNSFIRTSSQFWLFCHSLTTVLSCIIHSVVTDVKGNFKIWCCASFINGFIILVLTPNATYFNGNKPFSPLPVYRSCISPCTSCWWHQLKIKWTNTHPLWVLIWKLWLSKVYEKAEITAYFSWRWSIIVIWRHLNKS